MLSQSGMVWIGGILTITFVSRAWGRYKVEQRARVEGELPLFDLALLEIAVTARETDDDPAVLDEIRETLIHLNRRKFAAEALDLHAQLARFAQGLAEPRRPAVFHVAIRMIESGDPWLQTIGASTAAELGETRALPSIEQALRSHPSEGAAKALEAARSCLSERPA